MSDETERDYWDAIKAHKKEQREKYGIDCPGCKKVRPKACPTILVPGKKCKVCGTTYEQAKKQSPDKKAETLGDKIEYCPFCSGKWFVDNGVWKHQHNETPCPLRKITVLQDPKQTSWKEVLKQFSHALRLSTDKASIIFKMWLKEEYLQITKREILLDGVTSEHLLHLLQGLKDLKTPEACVNYSPVQIHNTQVWGCKLNSCPQNMCPCALWAPKEGIIG